jgi:hypothetical protein
VNFGGEIAVEAATREQLFEPVHDFHDSPGAKKDVTLSNIPAVRSLALQRDYENLQGLAGRLEASFPSQRVTPGATPKWDPRAQRAARECMSRTWSL